MAVEVYPAEWSVHEGYEAFVDDALTDLNGAHQDIVDDISIDTIRHSLQHPNGFLVNTLESSDEGQLRLHIWPTGRASDITPHSHPWHMASLVLAGTYREYIPDVRLDDSGDYPLMIPTFSAERKQVANKPSGRHVRFELGALASYDAGTHHTLPAGAFHATPLPEYEPIVTLVRTSPQLYENPSYVESQLNRENQIKLASDRQPPSEQEAQAIWRILAPQLEPLIT